LSFVPYFIDPLAGDSSADEVAIRRSGGDKPRLFCQFKNFAGIGIRLYQSTGKEIGIDDDLYQTITLNVNFSWNPDDGGKEVALKLESLNRGWKAAPTETTPILKLTTLCIESPRSSIFFFHITPPFFSQLLNLLTPENYFRNWIYF